MPTLSERLRSDTRSRHTAAERSATMRGLLRGELTRPAYGRLLLNLKALYDTLEPALQRHATHPLLAPVHAAGLWRGNALRDDLRALGCTDTTLVPATQAYVARLAELDAHSPHLLLAHAYVRYLGDLNGGQALGRVVTANAALGTPPPVAFYAFDDVAGRIAAFRDGLASLTPNATEADEIVAEAVRSFDLHIAMFDQLAAV